MWERGERERLVREDSEQQEKTWIKEQDKTINNKSSSTFNDTILNFEQIFTVAERDKFKNRDLKRTNTIDKFDEIFDSMDISQKTDSADSSEQSIEDKDGDLTEDDAENDETIKSEENSIIEAAKVLEDDIFKELDTQIFQDEEVKTESKLEQDSSEDESLPAEIEIDEDTVVCEEIDQLETSEESETEEQVCQAAVCDGLASSIPVEPVESSEADVVEPARSSESESDSGFDTAESARRFSRSSSGSPVAMLARLERMVMMMIK